MYVKRYQTVPWERGPNCAIGKCSNRVAIKENKHWHTKRDKITPYERGKHHAIGKGSNRVTAKGTKQ